MEEDLQFQRSHGKSSRVSLRKGEEDLQFQRSHSKSSRVSLWRVEEDLQFQRSHGKSSRFPFGKVVEERERAEEEWKDAGYALERGHIPHFLCIDFHKAVVKERRGGRDDGIG